MANIIFNKMTIIGSVNDVYDFRQKNEFNKQCSDVEHSIGRVQEFLKKNSTPQSKASLEDFFRGMFNSDGIPVHLQEQANEADHKFLSIESEGFSFNNIKPMPESLNVSESSLGWLGASVLLSYEEQELFKSSRSSFYSDYMLRDCYSRAKNECEKKGLKWELPYSKENYALLLKEHNPEALELGKAYIDNYKKYGVSSWYEWNVNNWGTKWDAMDVSPWNADDVQSNCSIIFSTAWSPAIAIYKEISSMYNVAVVCGYHDEGGNFSGVSVFVPKGWELPEELINNFKTFECIVDENNKVDEVSEVFVKDCGGKMRGVLGGVREYSSLMKKIVANQPKIEKSKEIALKIKLKNLIEKKVEFSDPLVKILIEKNGDNYGVLGAEWFFMKLLSECKDSAYFWNSIKTLHKDGIIDILKPIEGRFSIATMWANEGFAEGVAYARNVIEEVQGVKEADDYMNVSLIHNVSKNRGLTIRKLSEFIKEDFFPKKIDYKIGEHLTGVLYSLAQVPSVTKEYIDELRLFGDDYLKKNPNGLNIVCNMVRHEHEKLLSLKEAFVLDENVFSKSRSKKESNRRI